MNFDDTPQEAAFRAEAKAWIAANAPKQYEEDLRKSSLGRTVDAPNRITWPTGVSAAAAARSSR